MSKALAICAYCGPTDGKITREHIIPKFIYDHYEENNYKVSGWNEYAKKTVGGEFKIKDVCEKCNNELLGELDNYASHFLRQNGILTDVFLQESIKLTYDYDMLLRWLLKISFNAVRIEGSHAHIFSTSINYILHSDSNGMRDFEVIVQLLPPVQHSAEKLIRLQEIGIPVSSCGKTNPLIVRIGKAHIKDSNGGFITRTVIIGALVFYLFIYADNQTQDFRNQVLEVFLYKLKSGTIMRRGSASINLTAGKMTWIDSYGPSFLRAKSYDNMKTVKNRDMQNVKV